MATVRVAGSIVIGLAVALGGCGGKKDKPTSQTAAKVDKGEITVHQINFVLQQQRGLKPEQTEAASRQILERLIDQELAVQKATELNLDRDPRVMQQIEAAKREIIARAYAERVAESAARPTPEEVRQYYDDKPVMFKERRVFNIQELAIEAKPDQLPEMRQKLASAKTINEFVEYLKASEFHFIANQAVRTPEQLPPTALDAVSQLKDGQAMLVPSATGAQVVVLAGSRSQPMDFEQARPSIEQLMLRERQRQLVEKDLKHLREVATVSYVGKYADAASAPAGNSAAAVSAAASSSVEGGASAPGAATMNNSLGGK